MVIFNSYVSLPKGSEVVLKWELPGTHDVRAYERA